MPDHPPIMRPQLYAVMQTLATTIVTQGDGYRVRIPIALREIARVHTDGRLERAKELLREIRQHASDHFYFEGATEGVCHFGINNPRRLYINIDGLWRTTIVWTKGVNPADAQFEEAFGRPNENDPQILQGLGVEE